MKKIVIIGVVVAVVLVSAFFATTAFAAGGQSPIDPPAGTVGNGPGWFCPVWGNAVGPNGTYISPELQRIAGFLGLTPQDLSTQLQQGQTLAQIAGTKNINRQALLDAMLAPAKDQLQLGVKYGYMTQAQADAYLQQETGAANAFMDRVFTTATAPGQGYAPGYGQGYGCGGYGMMGAYGGYANNSGASQAPNAPTSPAPYGGRGWGMMGGGMMRGW